MPELPEVETIRRALEPVVQGRRVARTWSHPSARFLAARSVAGARLADVRRRGKYLLLGTGDGRELVLHLGMTGRLRVRNAGAEDLDDPYVRARWWLAAADASRTPIVLELHDVRRFGRLAVVPAGDYSAVPTLAASGPEPLSAEFTAEGLFAALRASRRRVKTQLLSQRPVAGVGNIYADEALWRASIAPGTRRVSRVGAARLHDAVRAVLQAGIDHGGTTLRDYRSLAGVRGRNQQHLRCYGRAGAPCARCATPLRHRVLDGRGTTWCPRCQQA